jgi:hypothetical protein
MSHVSNARDLLHPKHPLPKNTSRRGDCSRGLPALPARLLVAVRREWLGLGAGVEEEGE